MPRLVPQLRATDDAYSTRFGLATFASRAELRFHLGQYQTADRVDYAITQVPCVDGLTRLSDGLDIVASSLLGPDSPGVRPLEEMVPRLLIVLSDGRVCWHRHDLEPARTGPSSPRHRYSYTHRAMCP